MCVCVHDQMRLNYIYQEFDCCISLNRGDVKPSYGERIKLHDYNFSYIWFIFSLWCYFFKNDSWRKWH